MSKAHQPGKGSKERTQRREQRESCRCLHVGQPATGEIHPFSTRAGRASGPWSRGRGDKFSHKPARGPVQDMYKGARQEIICKRKKFKAGNFPGGPVVKNPPPKSGDTGSIPGQETKTSYAVRQLHLSFTMKTCACVPHCFSRVRLCATLWTIACQAPLSMGTHQARILEWVAMPPSKGSS